MGKVTGPRGLPPVIRRPVGYEILCRAQALHSDALEVIGNYCDLSTRYQRLVTAVDAFWDDVVDIDDALLDVRAALGLHAVLEAQEAAAQRFEDVGLDTFAAGARETFGPSAPALELLRETGAQLEDRRRRPSGQPRRPRDQ